MSIGYELIKELSVLSQGRNPVFTAQDETDVPTSAPSQPSDGVSLEDAIVAFVLLELGDATSVSCQLWGLPKGRTAWALLDVKALLKANFAERYVIAGFERLYVQITSTTGTVTPVIGPCELEA